MELTAFSDSHTRHKNVHVPDGDILIFAGDISNCRNRQDVEDFNSFLKTLPHKHKIVIGGNHDHLLEDDPGRAKTLLTEAIYLQDEMVVIGGVSIYGAPWQPIFNDLACDAFALPRGKSLQEKWEMIPDGLDILVTHSPPAGIMDQDGPVAHGCADLAAVVGTVKPKYHIFGHIHCNHGMIRHTDTTFINCNVQAGDGELRPAFSFAYSTGP